MIQVGGQVTVVAVRPPERMYISDFQVTEISDTLMRLVSVFFRDCTLTISVCEGKGRLDGDQLCIAPIVEVTEFSEHIRRGMTKEIFRAYYYKLGDNILLIHV